MTGHPLKEHADQGRVDVGRLKQEAVSGSYQKGGVRPWVYHEAELTKSVDK